MIAFKDKPDVGAATHHSVAPATTTAAAAKTQIDPEALGDEIARLAAHLHAATYELLVLIRAFDEGEGWGCGFRSCAEWLSWRTGIGPGPAREKVRVARALGSLPRISDAMARGEMSYSKVRALTRVATPENEAEVTELARHATAAHVEKLVRAWRRVDRLEGLQDKAGREAVEEREVVEMEDERRRHRNRYLRLHPDEDGSWVLRGRLDPEVGALLEQAVEWASDALYREEWKGEEAQSGGRRAPAPEGPENSPSFSQRQADALGLVVERAMAAAAGERKGEDRDGEKGPLEGEDGIRKKEGGTRERKKEKALREEEALREKERNPGTRLANRERCEESGPGSGPRLGRADRFQVVMHVDAGGQATLAGSGLRVSAETSRRISCDSGVVRMTHTPEGKLLDVGRRRRTVPPALRRALEYRDQECRFPGCGCRYTDAHHIVHWADGGETNMDNLVLLCRRHHRAVHEEGFRVEVAGCGGTASWETDSRRIEIRETDCGRTDSRRIEIRETDCGRTDSQRRGDRGRASPVELQFYRPDGRLIPVVPDPPSVPGAPAGKLVAEHRGRGITPGAWTATPLWHGERLDLDMAVGGLMRPEDRGPQRNVSHRLPRSSAGAECESDTEWRMVRRSEG